MLLGTGPGGPAEECEAMLREGCRGLRGASRQSTHLRPPKSHARGHPWLRPLFSSFSPAPALTLEDPDAGKGVEEQEGMKAGKGSRSPSQEPNLRDGEGEETGRGRSFQVCACAGLDFLVFGSEICSFTQSS